MSSLETKLQKEIDANTTSITNNYNTLTAKNTSQDTAISTNASNITTNATEISNTKVSLSSAIERISANETDISKLQSKETGKFFSTETELIDYAASTGAKDLVVGEEMYVTG